jgi:hypothetical protein
MKEIYEKPTTSVEEFKTVDVITTSAEPTDDNDTPFPW